MPKTPIKKILERAITVSKDELETTYIIQGRPLSDVIDILGVLKPRVVNISEKRNELGIYVPERPMHEVPPLAHIAQPLAFEVWVHFYDINGIPVYYITEPPIDDVGIKFYVYLRQRVGELGVTKPSELVSLARDSLEDLGVDARLALNDETIKAAIYYVFRDMLGYGPLEIPMEDVYVEEVSWFAYDGPVEVVDKKISDVYPNSEFIPTNLFFEPSLPDLQKKFFMTQVVRAVTSKARVGLTTARPLAEARIPDPTGRGFHRLAAHLDITSRSPAVTIRKFPHKKLSITELIKFGTLSPLEAAYLIWQLINRGFILIVGGMASGKSVTPLSHLLIRQGNSVRLVTFDELWKELSLNTKPVKMGEMEVINNPNIEVLTITEDKVEWKKPKYIIRHKHKGKIYRIRTKTGRAIEVTPDHSLLIWKVGDEKDRFSINLATIKPSELKTKEVYVPFLRRFNIKRKSVRYNTMLENPEIGYLIGFLVAEASNGGYVFEQAKGEVLEKVLKILINNNIPFSTSTYNKRKPHVTRVYIRSPFRKLILSLKLGKNSREKRIPDIFWTMDEEWRGAFLAGVVDGDGSIHPGKYIIEIATASHELAYGLLYAFASVGVHAYIRERRIKKYPDRVYYRVFVPVGINKTGLSKIMKYLSEEKRKLIEEAMEKSRNHHSETDIIPAEIAYAIGSMLKRKEHGRDTELSFEIRSYKYKKENPSFYRVENLLGEKLYEFIPENVGFDRVEDIEEIEYDGYVYDIEVPETQNFEANGIFVHNTTLLQALISALPVSYKVVCVAPGTRVAGEQPEVIDELFVGTPIRKDNMESVRRKVKVLGFKEGDVVWSTSDEVHKIYIPKEVKLVKITTEYGAEVTVTPNTKIPVFTDVGIKYKPASEINVGDRIPQLSYYEVKEKDVDIAPEEVVKNEKYREVITAPKEFIKKVIRILIKEKGKVDGGNYVIKVKEDSLEDLSIIFLRLGVVALLERSKKEVIVPIKEVEDAIRGILPKRKYIWVHVKSVEQVEHDGVVYDLSPKETKYFFAGNGGFIVVEDTVEDTPELSTPAQNWHPLYVRRAPKESELEDVTFSRLVIHSLRHRGTIVTLGEVRGAEMADLIQAAASGHGAICLPPDTPVLARRRGGEAEIVSIKELVDRYDMGEEWEVYSFNAEKGVFEWKPVTGSIHVQTDLWVKIETESGRKLKMTPDHRVPVLNPVTNEVEIVLAKDLRIGDLIPVAGRIPRDGVVYHFSCCGVYIPFSSDMGRLLGEALKGDVRGKYYLIPNKYKEVLETIPIKIPFVERDGKLKIKSKQFRRLIETMLDRIKLTPFKLPHYFLNGLGEVLVDNQIVIEDVDLLYKLHYALKTVGYDSVVDKENKTLTVTGKREEPFFFEKIVSVETEQSLYDDAYDIEVEGNHTFITGDSIITGNCTFHAHDPESVLARITSPPINAAPESLKLITAIVHIARTKTYARGKPESVRRVLRIFEIKDVRGKEIESSETFKWNPLTDKHAPPLTDEGLMELWRRSVTVQTLGKNIYVDEAPRALVELYVISKYLDFLVQNEIFDIKEVVFRMTTLYLRIDKMVDKLWREKYRRMFMPLMES